jgi:hypothetical protein
MTDITRCKKLTTDISTLCDTVKQKRNFLKHTFSTHYDIKGFMWFVLQPKSATEIGWWRLNQDFKKNTIKNLGFIYFFNGWTALVSIGILTFEVPRSQSDTSHSVGLFWTSDQPVAETSTWQHTPLTTDRHPCPLRDLNLNPSKRAAAYPRGQRDRPRSLRWH